MEPAGSQGGQKRSISTTQMVTRAEEEVKQEGGMKSGGCVCGTLDSWDRKGPTPGRNLIAEGSERDDQGVESTTSPREHRQRSCGKSTLDTGETNKEASVPEGAQRQE